MGYSYYIPSWLHISCSRLFVCQTSWKLVESRQSYCNNTRLQLVFGSLHSDYRIIRLVTAVSSLFYDDYIKCLNCTHLKLQQLYELRNTVLWHQSFTPRPLPVAEWLHCTDFIRWIQKAKAAVTWRDVSRYIPGYSRSRHCGQVMRLDSLPRTCLSPRPIVLVTCFRRCSFFILFQIHCYHCRGQKHFEGWIGSGTQPDRPD